MSSAEVFFTLRRDVSLLTQVLRESPERALVSSLERMLNATGSGGTLAADADANGYLPKGMLDPIDDCVKVCPNAINSDSWALWLLASMYYMSALGSIFLLFHRLPSVRAVQWSSFRSMFLLLAFCFSALKAILVTFDFDWVLFSLIFINYLMPVFFQFATFSLLMVFLAKCQYMMQDKDSMIRRRLYPTYAAALVVFFILSLVLAIVISDTNNPNDQSVLSRGFDYDIAIYSVIVFSTLIILVTTYGTRTYKLLVSIALSNKKLKKVRRFAVVAVVYVVVLLMRVWWDIAYLGGFNIPQKHMNQMIIDGDDTYFITMLVFYFIVDILPLYCLLFSFYCWLPNRQKKHDLLVSTAGYGTYNSFATNPDDAVEDE